MKAEDVMVRDVVTVEPQTSIVEAIKLLADHDISALPVVDPDNRLIGILSEADLLEREELGGSHHHPWWIEAITPASRLAEEFCQSPRQDRRTAHVDACDFSQREHAAFGNRGTA